MTLFLIILFGAAIGSFLTVIIFRTTSSETIVFRRSRCGACRHILSPFDLIPMMSYLMRLGKCAYCREPISCLYPVIEITTTLVFVFTFFLSNLLFTPLLTQWIMFFCLACLFSVLLVMFFRYIHTKYLS